VLYCLQRTHWFLTGAPRARKSLSCQRAHISLLTQRRCNTSAYSHFATLFAIAHTEASRLRQYFTRTIASYQHLRAIKSYRTPVGMRTLARLYILFTPLVMGPYYGYLAGAGVSGCLASECDCFALVKYFTGALMWQLSRFTYAGTLHALHVCFEMFTSFGLPAS
jgi:hypothetical protein